MLTYALALQWVYESLISPSFAYLGLRYREPDAALYGTMIVVLALTALVLPSKIRRPADFVLWLTYVFVIGPSVLVPQYAHILTPQKSTTLGLAAASSLVLIVAVLRILPERSPLTLRIRPEVVWALIGAASAGSYAYIFATTGSSLEIAALDEVRNVRFAYRDEIASSGALLGYIVRIQGNVLNPVIMAKGIYSRRPVLFIAGAVGQVLIFAATGYKLTLLSTVAVVGLAVMHRFWKHLTGNVLVGATILGTLLAVALDFLTRQLYFVEIFVNRLLLTPGALSAAHVMVFEGQEKAIWGHSFLSGVVEYPYTTSPSFIVGAAFSGNPSVSANASYIADGFANLGYYGILIEAVAMGTILYGLNATGSHLPIRVSSTVLLVPTIATANSGAFTSLLSNGYLLAMVLMASLPSSGWSSTATKGPQRDKSTDSSDRSALVPST